MGSVVLTKTDSTGRTRVWSAEVKGCEIHVKHGVEGGTLTRTVTTCQPKNIGKANERSAEEQAIFECAALYKKKQDRDGYGSNDTVYPMLARDYSKLSHQVKSEDVYISPKLDGVRAIWRPDKQKFQSRKGTFYDVPHLESALKDTQHLLDGELYIHNTPLNQIVSACRATSPLTSVLEFRVFDIVNKENFTDRYITYDQIVTRLNHPKIQSVVQKSVKRDEIKAHHDYFVSIGYEGVMIRTDGPYKTGVRSPDLFKYKEFQDDEFEVIDVVKDKHGQGVLKCKTDKGLTFDCRCRGTDEYRLHQAQNPNEYIGKKLTVRYFALTEYGLPQFPVGITLRDDIYP
jgi:ATP-dependent DNA ligase